MKCSSRIDGVTGTGEEDVDPAGGAGGKLFCSCWYAEVPCCEMNSSRFSQIKAGGWHQMRSSTAEDSSGSVVAKNMHLSLVSPKELPPLVSMFAATRKRACEEHYHSAVPCYVLMEVG